MKLGDYIKEYRRQHGMSQRDFAELTGMSKAYVSILERGHDSEGRIPAPTFKMIKQIADATHISMDEIAEMCGETIAVQSNKPKMITSREALQVAIDSMSDEKVDALLAAICLVERLSLDSKLMVAKVAYNAYEIEAARGQLENATISAPDMEFIHKALVEATRKAMERRTNYTAQLK